MPDRNQRAKDLRANILVVGLLVAVAVGAFVVTLGVRSDWFSGGEDSPELDTTLDEPYRAFVLEAVDGDTADGRLQEVASTVSDRLFAVGLTRIWVGVEDDQVIVHVPQSYLRDESIPDLEEILVSNGPVVFAPVLDDDEDEVSDEPTTLGDATMGHDVVWGLRLQGLDEETWTLAVDIDVNVDNPWPALVDQACDGDTPRVAALFDGTVIEVAELRTRQCRESETLAPQFGAFEEAHARRLAGLLTSPELPVAVELVDSYES